MFGSKWAHVSSLVEKLFDKIDTKKFFREKLSNFRLLQHRKFRKILTDFVCKIKA